MSNDLNAGGGAAHGSGEERKPFQSEQAPPIAEEVREEEAHRRMIRFEASLDNAPIGLIFFDRTHRLIRVNTLFEEAQGLPRDRIVGRRLADVAPRFAAQIDDHVDTVFSTGKVVSDLVVQCPRGEHHWRAGLFPVRSEDTVEYVGVYLVDVSEAKRHEQKLENQTRRVEILSSLVSRLLAPHVSGDISPHILNILREPLEIDYLISTQLEGSGANGCDFEYAGISEQQARTALEVMTGREDFDTRIRSGEILSLSPNDVPDVLPEDTTVCLAVPITRSDTVIGFMIVGSSKRTDFDEFDREFFRNIGGMFDLIKERRMMEQSLRRSDLEYRTLFEEEGTGKAETDSTGTLLRVNNKFCSMLGFSREELVGMNVVQITHPDDLESSLEGVQALYRGEIKELVIEKRYVRKDGSFFWAETTLSLIRDENGEPIHSISVVRDITERIKHAEALRKHETMLAERVQRRTAQVRALSHALAGAEQTERRRVAQLLHDDLQQVLHAAHLKTQVLSMDAADLGLDELATQIDEIKALLKRAAQTTRSLATELSPPALEEEDLTISLQWLAGHVYQMHELEVDFSCSGPCIVPRREVRTLIVHVVNELLFNVVKHAETKKASLVLDFDDDQVFIEVRDKGKGFDTSGGVKETSAAFGLASVRERLSWIDGSFEVISSPGQGTTVRISVPITNDADA